MAKSKSVKKILDATIYGSTNLGQRGQIVIPKQARENLKLKTREKFIVMEKGGCLVLIPNKLAAKFAQEITAVLTK